MEPTEATASQDTLCVRLRGDFKPVRSLLSTFRLTRGASRSPSRSRNASTAFGSRFASSRSDHDIALTTMSSKSPSNRRQTRSVLRASPAPPRAREFSGTVATSASRRRHRSGDRPHARIFESLTSPVRKPARAPSRQRDPPSPSRRDREPFLPRVGHSEDRRRRRARRGPPMRSDARANPHRRAAIARSEAPFSAIRRRALSSIGVAASARTARLGVEETPARDAQLG